MGNELLIEIGCEELPVWAIDLILENLRRNVPILLNESQLSFSNFRLLATPRRIVIMLDDVPSKQEDRKEWVTGPPKKVAFDEQGRPTQAAVGFAKKCGVDLDRLEVRQTKKGEYVTFERNLPGKETAELFNEGLSRFLSQIQFKKPMYWSDDK